MRGCFPSTQHAHALIALAVMMCALGMPQRAHTAPPAPAAEPDPPSIAEIFEGAGLTGTTGCLDLESTTQIEGRKIAWRSAINLIATHHPDTLHDWIIGAAAPPDLAMREAVAQRDCMLRAMVEASTHAEVGLDLELGSDGLHSRRSRARLARHWRDAGATRRHVIRTISRSHYRDARSQAYIWYRKFTFTHTSSFNLVTEDAAERCNLHAGRTWRPSSTHHTRCWKRFLTPEDRQRQILTASSAPGISRHHWGTEFDLFGLNPRSWTEGKPLYDEWSWMRSHGLRYGFFQPFLGREALGPYTYIEERWHWSYYPIAGALTEYIRDHQEVVDAALNAQWDSFEQRWSRSTPFFSFVRTHWRDYVLNIAEVEIAAHSSEHVHPIALAILAAMIA